jgi:hypothetical protein
MHLLTRLSTVLLLLTCLPALASDKAKEQRWANQIVDQLIEGEAVWLEAGEDRFLAILTEAEGEPRGTVIVMHGMGVHPNWPQVIYPLRTELPRLGWTTLSLQMPVLPNEAEAEAYLPLFAEVPPRLDAALAFLAERDALPAFLVGHSLGAYMGAYYLRGARAGGSVSGLVGIGMSGRTDGGVADAATSLAQIELPVLDLYGERDMDDVLAGVDRRFAAGSKNPRYEQRIARGANHFFDGQEAELVTTVDAWLTDKTLP